MKAYLQEATQVIQDLNSDVEGLRQSDADNLLAAHGENELAEGKKVSLIVRLLGQMKDPMIIILIVAGVVSGLFKEYADMVIILVVVVLNAVLGLFQESKAEKAIESLKKMSAPHCKVKRDGTVTSIESSKLVPGDIVLLEAGDSVPADMRLIGTFGLKIEEAALTGESVPAEKKSDAIPAPEKGEVPLGDRVNMAYMGTSVTYGRGEGIVTATGMKTEMGKIADILTSTENEKTPLQNKLAQLSKTLSFAVIGICIFIFFFSVFTQGGFAGANIFEILLTAVSLAVAAIPEGLVVVVTVLLSIGVTKMSSKRSIVRRLTAVETLGCTQVICSDKTGTLTQNKMTVTQHIGDEKYLAHAMYLCSDVKEGKEGVLLGDPTEVGLSMFAVSHDLVPQDFPRIGELPFDSDRKLMTTLHKNPEGGYIQFTKGAPDVILSRCTHMYIDGEIRPISLDKQTEFLAENKKMADQALRVLAAAMRIYDAAPENLSLEESESGLVFIGLMGMIDPVRPEVMDAIQRCRTAGIRPIMITGDHKDTAVAIAKSLGMIENENQAVTGAELSEMSDAEFEERIRDISVYARVQPEHKVRIVTGWKKLGKITAMTGDGVNDAPAIKTADIGIGMGITGTDVTKNVADMVLADDNFATIVLAVEEGRRIYENIRKAIQFLLSSNLSEVVSIFVATIMGLKLFAPIHILWINLVTDTFPAMALGMEEAEENAMSQSPRDPKETVFAGGLGLGVLYQGIAIAALTLVSFFIGHAQSQLIGMSMAFITLSCCEIFHSYNMRSRTESSFKVKGHNKFLLGAMVMCFLLTLIVMYIPGLNTVFSLSALSIKNFLTALGLSILMIPIVEIVKAIGRSRKS